MRARGPHLDIRAIADYQAGVRTGLASWRARRTAAHLKACARCQHVAEQLSSVSRTLATSPAPSMPPHVAERLSAALRAEQTARAVAPARSRQPVAPRRHSRLRPVMLVPVAAAIVLIAVAGTSTLLLRHSSTPPSVASGARSHSASPTGAAGVNPNAASSPRFNTGTNMAGYRVESSGTDYRAGSLASQASALLREASPATASAKPSSAIVACVSRVAGGARVRVVDQARYQGQPAFIIVSGTRAWVTGTSCPGSGSGLITSVGLPGGR